MGQYYRIINPVLRETIDPFALGGAKKAVEQCGFASPATALLILLDTSNGRGGGDFEPSPLAGRWAGDPILYVGDYGEPGDVPLHVPGGENPAALYCAASNPSESGWLDLSPWLRPVMEASQQVRYVAFDSTCVFRNGKKEIHTFYEAYDLDKVSTPAKVKALGKGYRLAKHTTAPPPTRAERLKQLVIKPAEAQAA